MTRVAYQGVPGANGEEAIRRFFGAHAEAVPLPSFQAVGEAVGTGIVERGVLPINNSIAGVVPGTKEILDTFDLENLLEINVPVHHCLLALPGVSISEIVEVRSHPMALKQCTRLFETNVHLRAVPTYDTAGAAHDIANAQDPTIAALASRRAAELYGLETIAENVEDRHDNETTFMIVTRRAYAHTLPTRG